ncbi:PucR family transcriptional regulator [Streptomyces sp. NPDC057702]|uniref:PucR family transcriptional regulator n=1 Tax=unclassified Streptomyces TaxID=2593676 RepID=UPI00369429BC
MGWVAWGTEAGAQRERGEPRDGPPARADDPDQPGHHGHPDPFDHSGRSDHDDRPAPSGRADLDPRGERAEDVLTLSRLAARRGAVRAIVEWLARRTAGTVTLIDADGTPALAPPPPPSAALRAATDAVAGLRRRGTPSAVLSVPASGGDPDGAGPAEASTWRVPGGAPPSAPLTPAPGDPEGAGASTVFLVSLAAGAGGGPAEGGPRRQAPYLVLIVPEGAGHRPSRPQALLADAARTLGLCWRLEEAERDRVRVEAAEAHGREAVLHLLMVGSVPAAHRIAAALRPPLPQLAYVYVIECPGQRRYEIADRIAHAARGRAWIVPCPVRPTHLIALVPATPEPVAGGRRGRGSAATALAEAAASAGLAGPLAARPGDRGAAASAPDENCATDFRATFGELPHQTPALRSGRDTGTAVETVGVRGLDRAIAERVPECLIGVSGEVPLRETPIGYEQAFHALAVARTSPSGRASFQRDSDLTPLAAPEALDWARELLAPCLHYVPPRRADPGGEELLGTLGSWLTFGGAASRHLKIHRNTLGARVRLIEELLGLDLGRLADQSAAWLALQLRTGPLPTPTDRPTVTLEDLLATPAAEVWARARLQPLERANLPSGPETVRAWLRADARLPQAASELGISLPGARKRLTRAEEALGRSLLHAPSAKYELWLAMRALGTL